MRFTTERRAAARSTGSTSVRAATPAARPPALLDRLDRRLLEALEDRVHLSVARDVNGFTVVTLSNPADRAVYVSNAGSDANPGTSPTAPLKTLAYARTLIRNGTGDQLLLRRGDRFNETLTSWTQSGRSAAEPVVIGAYTDPARPSVERPVVASSYGTTFSNNTASSSRTPLSNVDILGVSFVAADRNYRQPTANFTIVDKPESQGGTIGVNLLGAVSNVLIEDSSFQYFRHGLTVQSISGWGSPSKITVRRNVIADNYARSYDSAGNFITSEGIYAQDTAGLTLEENVFDHNGWTDPAYGDFGTFATIYNHNAYLNSGNSNVVVTGNVFANAASHGIQMRAGGLATNNLFINNPIAMSFGYVNGTEKPGGVTGEISGNVVYGSNSINGAPRGWGIEVGNTKPGGGTVIKNNIYTSYAAGGQPAIKLDYGTNNNNPAEGVGINDLTISNNVVYGWTKGVYINPGFVPGGTGRQGLNGLSVLNNEFQQVNELPVVVHGPAVSPTAETWRGNRYDTIGTASSTLKYWTVKGVGKTLAEWQALAEPSAAAPQITYPNPNVSPQAYNASVGGTGTLDAFLAEARKQSATFWRPQYRSVATINYMRAGFSGQRVDALPPAAALASAPVITAGGGATQTLTVTWSDDNQVNLASIGTGDLLVTGPNGYAQVATLVSATPNADGSVVAAVYTVPAAFGAWSAAGNGTYAVSVQGGEVYDKSNNFAPGGSLGSFTVQIAAAAPTASLAAVAAVVNPSAPATFTVTYNVASGGIDVSTLGGDDLTVTSPDGGTLAAVLSGVSPAGSGAPRTATYLVGPPPGGWTEALNGTYAVAVNAGSVLSTLGVGVGTAVLGSFQVNVSVPGAVATAPTVTVAGTAAQTITVTYRDASGINAATVDANDVTVEGPNGFLGTVTLQSKTGAGTSASPLVATYRLAAPAGGWTFSENGTYFVVLGTDQVRNAGGVAAAGGTIGTFDVDLDTGGPNAVASAPDVYKPLPGPATVTIAVAYADQTGVNTSTIGPGDLYVVLPDGTTVVPTYLSKSGSGRTVTGTYRLTLPAGVTPAENGSYAIYLDAGAVSDTLGQPTDGGNIGYFQVNIDDTPPQANGYPSSYTDAQTGIDVAVDYFDSPGVDDSTVDATDVVAVGPGGVTRAAVLVGVDPASGGVLTAHYQIPAPAGGWQAENNGNYQLFVQANAVADLSGNKIPLTPIGDFTVAVATAPSVTMTADATAPGEPVDAVTIRFNQTVSGFGIEDLRLSPAGSGENLLDGLAGAAVQTTDGITFQLTGLSEATAAGGTYTLTLTAADSNVVGEYGLPLTKDATLQFGTDLAPPTMSMFAQPVTAAGAAAATFTVTFMDGTAVNANTLGDGDFLVQNPANGYKQVAKLVSLDSFASGPVRVATYSVPAPAGGWSAAWNGTYAILTRPGEVADTLGNKVIDWKFLGSLSVDVSGTGGQVDTTPPTASVAAVASPRATAVDSLAITFSERVFNLDLTDLSLSRNGGGNLLTSAQSLTTTDGITYTLNGLTALTAADGAYTLTVGSTGTPPVADASGNALAAAATRSWTVSTVVTTPTPTITVIAPSPVTGSATAQNLTITGTNFSATTVIKLRNLTTGAAAVTPTVVSRTATQIVVSQVFGTAASTWSAEALNGTASSGQAAFFVAAPATTTLGIGVSASPVTGKTAALTVQNGGTNTTTKFGWSVTTKPSGATAPTFSANNSNAAKNTTVTFSAAGTYTIKLTSTTGTTVKTATATVTVAQTFTSVKMTPTSASVNQSATKQFAASAVDQFGAALASQPAFAWSVDAGGVGTVSTAGLYTAPSDVTGSATVRAATGGKSATAAVTVTWPAAKINFQKSGSPTVSGYLADYGDVYNTRNGRIYGWSVGHTDAAVDRNKISNQLTDTNVGIKSGAKWELYVPKGTYSVKVSVGDSGASSKNTVVLEGTTVVNGVSLAANAFKTVTATVTVSDGRLTLTAGSAANLATRLDYIEVTKVG